MVDQTPYFSDVIMEDIRPSDGWILHVPTEPAAYGTPVEITQDRFRGVFPNTTKQWTKVQANGPGCVNAPCDVPGHQIGWGADRLTFFAEQQTWETPEGDKRSKIKVIASEVGASTRWAEVKITKNERTNAGGPPAGADRHDQPAAPQQRPAAQQSAPQGGDPGPSEYDGMDEPF